MYTGRGDANRQKSEHVAYGPLACLSCLARPCLKKRGKEGYPGSLELLGVLTRCNILARCLSHLCSVKVAKGNYSDLSFPLFTLMVGFLEVNPRKHVSF